MTLTTSVTNKTFVCFVGLEGAGHPAVESILPEVFKTCGKTSMITSLVPMRYYINHRRSDSVVDLVEKDEHDVMMNTYSFPCQGSRYVHHNVYNISWVYETLSKLEYVKVKMIYLSREPVDISGHRNWDRGSKVHALKLYDFHELIYSHYNKTRHYDNFDLWRKLDYSVWDSHDVVKFRKMIENLINFLDWRECDVNKAVEAVESHLSAPANRSHLDTKTLDFINSKNWNIPMKSLSYI